jgi:hemolysin activation/secretion protein
VCSITGGDFTSFYNQPEGTFFADITPQSIAQLATVLAVNSGSSQNQHGIYKTNAALTAAGLRWGATSVLTGFAIQAAITTGTDVAISRSKLSYAYKLDDFSFAYAGTIVGTDTSGTLPSPTTMQIGNRDGTLQINGHLASIRYYKKRLPNAKLQALTA